MFFLIPINTDAPIYHWPYGTVGLILLNIYCLFGIADPTPYALDYSGGLQPIQWVTSNFMHAGLGHLVGNMIFLWGYGIIVEGKLGLIRFVALYLLIGILQCAGEQTLMHILNAEGSSLGASSIIYGLLAISVIWAPRNELTVFVFIFLIRVVARTFEISILTFGSLYIGIELLTAIMTSFQMSSAMLHLAGVAVGASLGVLFLKMGWVDCEGWDLFSVMSNQHIRLASETIAGPNEVYPVVRNTSRKSKSRSTPAPLELIDDLGEARESKRAKRVEKIRRLLTENKPTAAALEYENARKKLGEFTLSGDDLKRLAGALYEKKLFLQSLPFYEQYTERFPEQANVIRLRVAAIYLDQQERPRAALRMLAPIPPNGLPDRQEQFRQKIEKVANRLIDDGVLEMDRRSGV